MPASGLTIYKPNNLSARIICVPTFYGTNYIVEGCVQPTIESKLSLAWKLNASFSNSLHKTSV